MFLVVVVVVGARRTQTVVCFVRPWMRECVVSVEIELDQNDRVYCFYSGVLGLAAILL